MTDGNGGDVEALPRHIRQWVAQSLTDGYSKDAVCQKLAEIGYAEQLIKPEIEAITSSPAFVVALTAAIRRDKLASLLDALAHQFRRSSFAQRVPITEHPDPDEFFEDYYFGNRPVIVRGLMADWPALAKWTPTWLGENYGDVEVEVTTGRDEDPRFEDNFPRHRQMMRLGDFIDLVLTSVGNNCYIVAKNGLLLQPDFADLLSDFTMPVGFLESSVDMPPRMWVGPADTVTPLHHDQSNIFFGQVFGIKRIRLIPPFEIENVYNDRDCYSAVDLDAIDLEKYPEIANVCVLDATVAPGDFLLLPVGWWHMVRSLSPSISLSFINFAINERPIRWELDRPLRKR
jgi:hypothetical protein